MELLYLLVAIAIGALLYRYFTGRGGIDIVRADYAGLPPEGSVIVRRHEVRWSVADDDSFVAAWQLASGHFVVMRVEFDSTDEEGPDQGYLTLSIDKRVVERDIGWTEKIKDRALRADVEAALKTLSREAKIASSDTKRVAGARSIGDDRDG